MKIERIDLGYEPSITNEFIKLFEERVVVMEEKIKFANDELLKVKYQIDKFYTEESIFEGKQEISIEKWKADKLIDRKLNRYLIIIGLLTERYKILQERIISGYYKDPMEFNDAKIDTLKTAVEIRAKEEFVKKNRERKNIYNK